jgi:hypothetical protein
MAKKIMFVLNVPLWEHYGIDPGRTGTKTI